MRRVVSVIDPATNTLCDPADYYRRKHARATRCRVGSPVVVQDWQERVWAPCGGPEGRWLSSRADQREMCAELGLQPCGDEGALEAWEAEPWEPVDCGKTLHDAMHGYIHVPEEVKARMEGRAGVAPTAEPIATEAI